MSRTLLIIVTALGAAIASAGCATSSALYTGELRTTPVLSGTHALGITLEMGAGDASQPVIIDTGSIYYFKGGPAGQAQLPCAQPETFDYAVGSSSFCPSSEVLSARGTDGRLVTLRDTAVKMGTAAFSDWEPGIPYAVLGLAGNMVGQNLPQILPVVGQLGPAHLTFQFPDGGLREGTMSFGPMPADRLAGQSPIPLVSPGSLGYGYTAAVKRMEFLVRGQVDTVIAYERDGVYLEHGSSSDKIAEQHLAFFDTGTPLPLVFSNGDVSLLSADVAAGNIGTKTTGTFYDELRVVFEDASGNPVVLSSTDLAQFRNKNPSSVVPTRDEFPSGMKMLASVVGYPVLSQYDLQIDFDGQTATNMYVVSR